MAKEHGESGEFVETVTLEKVREVFDDVRGPVVLSADVADRLDCSRETARRKLKQLHDRGDLDRRKVSRRVLYWGPTQERQEPSESAALAAAGAAGHDRSAATSGDEQGAVRGETSGAGDDTDRLTDAEDLRARVAGHLAGEGEVLERRVDAILRMYTYLQEHGTAKKAEFLDRVDADAVNYADENSVWANMVKGRDTLRALPGAHPPATGKVTWKYVDADEDST